MRLSSKQFSRDIVAAQIAFFLLLRIIFSISSISAHSTDVPFPERNSQKMLFTTHKSENLTKAIQIEFHDPILIQGNNEFTQRAISEGWNGNGTFSSPYVISGYDFVDNGSEALIKIQDTSLFFLIENCQLNEGINEGIGFENVTNGGIERNNISLNGGSGIFLHSSKSCTIEGNIINDNGDDGIILLESFNIGIKNNLVSTNEKSGIICAKSESIFVQMNTVSYNHNNGIDSYITLNMTVINNELINHKYGVLYFESEVSEISENYIIDNTLEGVRLQGSRKLYVSNNTIQDNQGNGFKVDNSSFLTFSHNLLHNNSAYQVLMTNTSWNNTYSHNLHFNPYNTTPQAHDEGLWNIFRYNFWNDWVDPDEDKNGLVDFPYLLSGTINNSDPTPLVDSGLHLYSLEIISPKGGEALRGKITINWTAAVNHWGEKVTYSVYYSSDGGSTWNLITSKLVTTFFLWDSLESKDSSICILKIVALSESGATLIRLSDNYFSIRNRAFLESRIFALILLICLIGSLMFSFRIFKRK